MACSQLRKPRAARGRRLPHKPGGGKPLAYEPLANRITSLGITPAVQGPKSAQCHARGACRRRRWGWSAWAKQADELLLLDVPAALVAQSTWSLMVERGIEEPKSKDEGRGANTSQWQDLPGQFPENGYRGAFSQR